ncbi:MAG: hypothetical protein AAFX99_17760 [Myxococcota bacterium]
MITRIFLLLCCSVSFTLIGCGGGDGGGGEGGSNGTNNNTSNSTNNGTSNSTSNDTSSTSNDTTGGTNNETTPTGPTSNQTTTGPTTPVVEGTTLTIDGSARACELVLIDSENALTEVVFTEGQANGRFMRRGERVAVAFHAVDDAAMPEGAVILNVLEGGIDNITINTEVSRCFGADGQPLSEAGLEIKP